MMWKTDVGSHMWNMERPDSDHDYFVVRGAPLRSILLGHRHDGGHHTKTEEGDDRVSYEIGHVVRYLLKGNVNFVWGLTSPLVLETSRWHERLKKIWKPTQNCFYSINGLARNGLHKLENQEPSYKKLNLIARTLLFGIRLLEGNLVFESTSVTSEREVRGLLVDLQVARENSSLPPKPDREPYEEFLLDFRLKEVNEFLNPAHYGDVPIEWETGWEEFESAR